MIPMNSIYQEEKQKLLDSNYNKYMNKTLKELQKDYSKAQKDIESEIAKWYARMDDIKKTTPEFRFSELKHLEDLQKQIKLILDELAVVEETLLTETLKELYVSDFVDLQKLNEKYGLLELNSPLPEFNQLPKIQVLETYISMPNITATTKELAKLVDLELVGDAISGKWFSTRIMERAEKLNYSIEDKIRQAIIRGDSYSKTASVVAKDLKTSYKSVKTLVRTEMSIAENKSVTHNAMKLGFNGLKWSTYHDDTVCKICREMDGTIFPVEQIKSQDLIAHPNCRCTLVEVVLDENGKEIKSQFVDEAERYLKDKAKQRKAEAERIKAMHMATK